MDLLSNRTKRSSLKPGDHIYSWRGFYMFAHHGIFVGDDKVIHFTRRGLEVGTETILDALLVSSVPKSHVPCPTCAPAADGHGVISSCLDCFLAGGILYRFEYAVNPVLFLAKRGGTCTREVADADDVVVHRAKHLLDADNGFGCYNVFKNNCEDFAIYCKTELLAQNQRMGQSGQAASVIGVPLVALLAKLRPFTNNVYVTAATAAVNYCTYRYATDIGRRSDVVKVPVEEVTMGMAVGMLQVIEPNLAAVPAPASLAAVPAPAS